MIQEDLFILRLLGRPPTPLLLAVMLALSYRFIHQSDRCVEKVDPHLFYLSKLTPRKSSNHSGHVRI